MNAKKLVKWGVALTSTLVFGGVVGTVGGNLMNTTSVVYAEEKPITYTIRRFDYENRVLIEEIPYTIYPGETIQIALDDMLGYKLRLGTHSFPVSYDAVLANGVYSDTLLYDKIDIGGEEAEIPTEKPVETPVEQPISVAIIAISEADGPLSHYYVTINPGETKTVEAPKVDGYKLDQYAGPTYELTYDYALGLMNSGGSAWVQFWMIKDTAPETPVDQPVEQPVEKPVEPPTEQPVEQPVEQPAEKPVEQPAETPAGQPTEKPATTPIEQPAEKPVEQPAETPTEQPTEKPATTPTDQPTEQPVETPAGQPTDQPVATPTDQPTEKPAATSLLAGNTASKAQTGATADKKKVDNSTPSTNAVKPEEGSQATAKTLPKTGDSSSMLLVLGGLLSGLSGLGLAATSRKRD
ncbi:TPA: LPXTG cell wall anchor domain-containing protein [Streptococcus suis]